MKKKYLFLMIIGFAGMASAYPSLWWYSNLGAVIDRNDNLVVAEDEWYLELVNVSTSDILLTTINSWDADNDGQFFYTSLNPDTGWGGFTVKTVVYDNTVKADADYYAEFSTQYTFPATWDTTEQSTDVLYAAAGGVSVGDWQAIPEPTVAGLIGIAGFGMLIARRLKRK